MKPYAKLASAAPQIVVGAFMLVIAGALAGAALPSLGYLPAAGGVEFSLEPFRALAALPGISQSTLLGLRVGLMATAISFILAVSIVAAWSGTAPFRHMLRVLAPLLSLPHAATAFALAFLLAPSGLLLRLFSPWATGLTVSPDILTVQDEFGLAMIAGLVAKEVPFLLLVIIAALPQCDAVERGEVSASLGYHPFSGWMKSVFPGVYAQIRLPLYAVIAYATSSVEIALILGPTTPPTLAVRLTQLVADPDLSVRFTAAAAAVLQVSMTLSAFAVWRAAEFFGGRIGSRFLIDGRRHLAERSVRTTSITAAAMGVSAIALGFSGLLLASFAGPWRFPQALPRTLTTQHWERAWASGGSLLETTVLLGICAVIISLTAVIAILHIGESSSGRTTKYFAAAIYAPLLFPQVVFVFGLKSGFLQLGLGSTFSSVLLAHIIFVLPYVYLSFAPAWNAWNRQFGIIAAALGASPASAVVRVRLPMLLGSSLVSAAVGFSVSAGQYLPTVLIGGGRIETITSEAVALAAGGNRQIIGVYALLQALLPLLAFALAIGLPRLVYRNRRGVKGWR